MESEMETDVLIVFYTKSHVISENKRIGLNMCSDFADKSQSDNEDLGFKSTVEQLDPIVEKVVKSGMRLQDIQGYNEILDTVHSCKRQLPISREENKGFEIFESEKLLPAEREEESKQRLQNAKSTIYDKFSRREQVQSKDKTKIIAKYDEFSRRELVQSKNKSKIIAKSTKHDKFSRRELVQSKDKSKIIRFLLTEGTTNMEQLIEDLSKQIAMKVESDAYDISSRREPVSINATRSFLTKVTADMELSIEKLPEQMAIMAVTVDPENLLFGKLLIKEMQDYPQLAQYMHERFLYQKVMQQPSKTDGTQELVELLLKQPHELKQHFLNINPDGNIMLIDGRVYLFGMSKSALVPALIFPQQSETMLSCIRSIDGLLSFNDDHFSEETHANKDASLIKVHLLLMQLKHYHIVHKKVRTNSSLQGSPFNTSNNPLLNSKRALIATVQPKNAFLHDYIIAFSGGYGDEDPNRRKPPKLAKKIKPNNDMRDLIDQHYPSPMEDVSLDAAPHLDLQTPPDVILPGINSSPLSTTPPPLITAAETNPSITTLPEVTLSSAFVPEANPSITTLPKVNSSNATTAPEPTAPEFSPNIALETCVLEDITPKLPELTLPANSDSTLLFDPHEAASVGTSLDRTAKNAISNELSDILSSACEQYEAMNYEEMAYMLSKSSHLARTCYESAVLSFAQGLAAFVQNKNEEAIDHFQEALSIFEGLRTNDIYINDILKCLEMMAKSERSQGHYRSASEYFERILSAHWHHQSSSLEELLKLEKTSLSSVLSDYAMCLRSEDRVVDSERYYRRAVSCPDATPTDRISALTGLGNLLHSVGSNDKAVTEYIAAIELAEKEKEYLSLAWAHGNLGNTYLSLGRKEKGLSHLQTSLNLTLDHDPDPSSISRALNNLGTAYQSLNELDKAELYFDQALSQAIYANDLIGQARAYGNIGNVYMLLKDFLKAIPHYTEVLRLSRDRSTVYVAYHNRGCALFELAEKKKGEQYQFMKRGEFQFIAIGPDTGDMEYKHQPEEELDEHTTELYQQALKDLRKVIKNVESTFSNASATTVGLDLYLSLFHINAKTFQRAQDCAFNLRDHYLSLTIAEQARARTLGELLLKRKSHQLPTSFTTPLNIDQIKLAVELLPDPYTPVVVLSYTGTRLLVWVLVFDGKMVSINSFEQEPDDELFGKSLDMYLRYELAEELTGNIDLYGEEKEKLKVTLEEVEEEKREEDKEKENDEKVKLDSIHEKKESDDDSSKAAVDANKLEKTLTESVKQERKQKARSGPAAKRWILSSLYKMISKPLEAILKAVIPESILQSRGPHKIILIPDNTTKMIPFNALLNEEGGAYFGDKYVLQFFPSVLSLGIMSQAPPTIIRIREHTTEEVLIVGDPSTPSFNFEGEDWTPGPLPHAKKEAEWVGHYLGTPPLLGEEPTKEVVKSRLSQSKLIHLATHGSASHGFVVLAGHCYNRQSTLPTSYRYTEDQDKLLLYSSEIESLCLRSPLVILSSCDSGRGRFKGDEIQGMSRSFLLAGAAAVMASLWKVPDQSASFFMQFFYRYLLDGHTSSVALQKSIQSIRSIHHFSQVIHWGGYQLTGSDVKIVVDVSEEDEKVLKALGCSGGSSPFPRLELLQQLENNLLSPDERHVQILYGPCGTDPIETVKDFIAKHHDAYKGIYWCNAVHCNVMNETVKMMQKFCGVVDGSGQSVLLVIDSATVDSLSCLTSLPPFIDVILIADSLAEYNELSKQVDEKLKRRVHQLPTIKPLTDLESTQRIVYSIVNNEEDLELNSEDISEVAVSCSGSPSLVSVAEPLIKELQAVLRSLEEIEKQPCAPLRIIECLPITPSSRTFLNCASVFHGVPVPKPFLVSLENEILDASVSSSPSSSSFFSSDSSPVSSLSCSSTSSLRPLSCITELIKWNCLKHYPTPVVIQSSAKGSSPLNMTLFTLPGIISESIWNNMDNEEKLFAIGVAYRTIKKKATQLSGYSYSLICQLLERYEDIEESNDETEECFIHLLSLKELF